MKKAEFHQRLKQVAYLEQVNHRFEALMLAFRKFNEVWDRDSDHYLALNDYLTTMYPFDKSFDEVLIDFALWYADGASKIVRAKNEIQPRLSIQEINDMVDEPEAEYDHHQDDDPSPSSWEAIAELRMAEIRRLRAVCRQKQEKPETSFIYEIGTEQTGGGVMVDFMTFKTLPFVLGITDESVVLYKDRASFCGNEDVILDAMSLTKDNIGYKTELTLARMRNKQLHSELQTAIEKLNSLLTPRYYVVKVWGDVEPEISVVSPTEDMRDSLAKQLKALDTEEEGENYSGFYWLNIIHGIPEIGSYSGAFFENENEADKVEEQRGEYSPQTSMFTQTQMTGSAGQISMLDQINEVEDTIARLKTTPHTLWTNRKGGTWIQTTYSDLVLLDIHLILSDTSFSHASYALALLDTEKDMEKYIKAIFGENYKKDPQFKAWRKMLTTERSEHAEKLITK